MPQANWGATYSILLINCSGQMFTNNFKIHIRIINFWLSFILLLIIISNLPHEPVPILTWLNCSIYFFLFIQCLFLIKQDKYNKLVFLNISLFALFHSLSFVCLFIGDDNFIGNDYHAWFFYEYINIIQTFVFVFCIVYICIKYLFKSLNALQIYGISLGIILPIFLWHFYPFLMDKEYILEIDEAFFYKSILLADFLPLLFLMLYGIILYKYDRSIGEHINTIVVCFFIMIILDITGLIGNIYDITIFSLTQYILLITLSLFLVTAIRLLNYVYSQFGQFYNSIVISGNNSGVPIKRKKNVSTAILDFAKVYFHQRRNTIGFLTLLFIFCINYFNVSLYLKLNMAAISFLMLILFYFLTALYQKRLNNGNLIIKNK